MASEPFPYTPQDLPTDHHRAALARVIDEIRHTDHLLLITGSVAQRRATPASDIDLLIVVETSEAAAGLASLAVGWVLEAVREHGVVSVTRYLSVTVPDPDSDEDDSRSIKVSMRIMQRAFLDELFNSSQRHTIWKTNAVLRERSTPENLIQQDGTVEQQPFEQTAARGGGYAYPLRVHDRSGHPALNVESTMLLTAKVVVRNRLDFDIPALVARHVLSPRSDYRNRVLSELVAAEYLDPERVHYLDSLASP